MNGEIQRSIQEASRAMERLILSFQNHIEKLESSGGNPEEIQRLTVGMHAVRDSAGIYMSWAQHFAAALGEGEEEARRARDRDLDAFLNEFLDEGGGTTENPFFGS
jgi:hypothetical protein